MQIKHWGGVLLSFAHSQLLPDLRPLDLIVTQYLITDPGVSQTLHGGGPGLWPKVTRAGLAGLALCGVTAGALQIPEKQQELWLRVRQEYGCSLCPSHW